MTTADPDVVIEAERRAPDFAARIEAARAEVAAQTERWFLWAPVAAGAGAALYLGLAAEPALALSLGFALVAILFAVMMAARGRSRLGAIAATLLAFGACGFAGSALRTWAVAAPVVPAGLQPPIVEGWVIDVDAPSADRPRLLIAPTWVQGLTGEATPRRIRVTLRDSGLIEPGRAIRVRALLNPPPPPASPGAYDFAR